MTPAQVKVPPEYFRLAIREYSNWITAWAREALQNSLDAGATDIKIGLSNGEDGLAVTFSDNGAGMDEDTLKNVFLCMGGSAKGEGSVGGFGYAKTLLCFAHKHYRIESGTNRISGVGGDYTHHHAPESEFVDGVTLRVLMSGDLHHRALMHAFQEIIDNSVLDAQVSIAINGEPVKVEPREYEYHVDTELGAMHFSDHPCSPSKLWVRSGGLAMFCVNSWTEGSHFRGAIDLQGNTLELLTSNRDSLRDAQSSILNDIVRQLSNERGSLKCRDLLDVTLNPESERDSKPTEDQSASASAISIQGDSTTQPQRSPIRRLSGAFEQLNKNRDDAMAVIRSQLNSLNAQSLPQPFRIRTSDYGTKSNKRVTTLYKDIFRTMQQSRIQKMARAWHELVRLVLSQPAARMKGVDFDSSGKPSLHKRPIRCGFVFSDSVEGLHMDQPEKGYDVLFNPLTMPKFNLEDMLDVALHECAHLWVRGHHEEFTTLESQLRRGLRQYMPLAEIRKHVRVATDLSLPVKGPASPVSKPPAPSEELPVNPSVDATDKKDSHGQENEGVSEHGHVNSPEMPEPATTKPWPPTGVTPAPF